MVKVWSANPVSVHMPWRSLKDITSTLHHLHRLVQEASWPGRRRGGCASWQLPHTSKQLPAPSLHATASSGHVLPCCASRPPTEATPPGAWLQTSGELSHLTLLHISSLMPEVRPSAPLSRNFAASGAEHPGHLQRPHYTEPSGGPAGESLKVFV